VTLNVHPALQGPPPEVEGLDEFVEKMEKHGLRVHHIYRYDHEGSGYWSIEVERTQRLWDGRVHMVYMPVSPQFVGMGIDTGQLVSDLLKRQQEHMIKEERSAPQT
jgi:hypothetical protein